MTAILTAIMGQIWPYILAGIVSLAGLWGLRRSGVKAERARQAEREREARDIADQVDNDVGAIPPKVAREELGKWAR